MNVQRGMQDSLETVFERSVEIEITNETREVILHSPRSYCVSGHSLQPPSPRILPGSKESCLFTKGRYSFRGSVGLLVYNSDAFTLAVMFSNPFDYNFHCIEFALEISPGKDHLSKMEEIYARMYNCTPADGCTMFKKAKLGECQEALVVTAGNIRVMATMSNAAKAVIKVLIEDKGTPPPYSQNPPDCTTYS
ncbi:DELTA-sagatoxin-Srs1a-like [Emydura macquarii macquarii]|uniref:DELTA-sagatoxin-Srs1a-like n=1 Tax=Emydura macquarii macquarii TaxID=1129001 RepID=UPI00352B2AC2